MISIIKAKLKGKHIFISLGASMFACAISVPAFAVSTASLSSLRLAHLSNSSATNFKRRAPLAGVQIAEEGDDAEPYGPHLDGAPHKSGGYEVESYYFQGEETPARHKEQAQPKRRFENKSEQYGEHLQGDSSGPNKKDNPDGHESFAPDSD